MAKTATVKLKIEDNFKETSKNTQRLDKNFVGLDKNVAKLGASMLALKVGTDILGSLANAIVDVGMEFETSYAMTSTLMTGTTEEIKAQGDALIDLSASYGKAGTQGAEAMYQALSAGVEQTEVLGFLDSAMKGATASGADLTGVVDTSTTVLNAYKLEATEAENIINMLMETQNAGKTTVEEMSKSYGALLPIAAATGVTFENVSAATATMTAQGIGTAEAMTMQKALFNELSTASSKTAQILNTKTGRSFKELMDSGMNLTDVLAIIEEEADANGVSMNNLFSSVEASTGAMALGSENAKNFESNMARLTDETKELDSAYETNASTTENLTNVISQEFNAELTKLWSTIAELLQPVLEWLSEHMSVMTPIIIVLAVVIGIISVALGVYAISASLAAIANLALLWPILLIVVAIMALITVIVLIIAHWDWLKKKTIEVWSSILTVVMKAWSWIKGVFQSAWDWLKDNWESVLMVILGIVFGIFGLIVGIIIKYRDEIVEGLKAGWDWIKNAVKITWNYVKTITSNTWNAIKNGIANVWEWIRSKITSASNGIRNVVLNTWSGIKNGIANSIAWVIAKVDAFKNKLLSIKNTITSTFSNITSGVSTGIQSGINTLISSVKSIANGFIGNVNSAIGTINKIPSVNIPSLPYLAIGTNLVNQDGMAFLHKGEAVVPADVVGGGFDRSQFAPRRDGISGSGDTYYDINIEGDATERTIDKIFDEIDRRSARVVGRGVRYR